jgi:hypothetical protein
MMARGPFRESEEEVGCVKKNHSEQDDETEEYEATDRPRFD